MVTPHLGFRYSAPQLACPRNLSDVSVARSLERRLELLVEVFARRVFSGRIHSTELAARIAREADLARFEHPAGPATANFFVLSLNPRDIEDDPADLQDELEKALAAHAAESGLRLEGRPVVQIEGSDSVAPGQMSCAHMVKAGPLAPWARLVGAETHLIGPNRAVIGRSEDSDIRLAMDEISRRHALIYRDHGQAWVSDLGSANGTWVDGIRLEDKDVRLEHGAMVTLATCSFRFLEM